MTVSFAENVNFRLTLASAQKGKSYKIKEIKGGMRLHRRLLDMGLTAGTSVYVAARAVGGGAVLVSLRGVFIALRDTAASVVVLY
ncbi:MAG: ferrous iron transport protein A [Firmicutes bacterium]|nr:ferrous iron transport protein A [Bacillota bacterium]